MREEDRHRAEAPATAIAVGGALWSTAYFFFAASTHVLNSLSFTTRIVMGMKA
jgi:hypothetical protein